MVEYHYHILIDGQINTFEQLAEYLTMGWELQSGSYPTLGTENMRIIRLQRFDEGEKEYEEGKAAETKLTGLYNVVSVDIAKVKDLKESGLTDEDILNLKATDIGNKLLGKGWNVLHQTSTTQVLGFKKPREPPVQETAVVSEEEEAAATEVEQTAPQIEKKVYVPAAEQVKSNELEIRRGDGVLVETVDASPEAVEAAQERLDLASKDILLPEAETSKEAPEYNRELLGCDDCKNDETCSLTKKGIYTNDVYEFTGLQGVERPQKCPEFAEVAE